MTCVMCHDDSTINIVPSIIIIITIIIIVYTIDCLMDSK